MEIMSRNRGENLVRRDKAKAICLVYIEEFGKTYMAIDLLDSQITAHYRVGDGDLRGTDTGRMAELIVGL